METPRQLTEDEVKAASEGRSEHVLGPRRPIALTEEEVKAASEGRSEHVLGAKIASTAGPQPTTP